MDRVIAKPNALALGRVADHAEFMARHHLRLGPVSWGINLVEIEPRDGYRRYAKVEPHEFYCLIYGWSPPLWVARLLWRHHQRRMRRLREAIG
jgi:hypothetical protein